MKTKNIQVNDVSYTKDNINFFSQYEFKSKYKQLKQYARGENDIFPEKEKLLKFLKVNFGKTKGNVRFNKILKDDFKLRVKLLKVLFDFYNEVDFSNEINVNTLNENLKKIETLNSKLKMHLEIDKEKPKLYHLVLNGNIIDSFYDTRFFSRIYNASKNKVEYVVNKNNKSGHAANMHSLKQSSEKFVMSEQDKSLTLYIDKEKKTAYFDFTKQSVLYQNIKINKNLKSGLFASLILAISGATGYSVGHVMDIVISLLTIKERFYFNFGEVFVQEQLMADFLTGPFLPISLGTSGVVLLASILTFVIKKIQHKHAKLKHLDEKREIIEEMLKILNQKNNILSLTALCRSNKLIDAYDYKFLIKFELNKNHSFVVKDSIDNKKMLFIQDDTNKSMYLLPNLIDLNKKVAKKIEQRYKEKKAFKREVKLVPIKFPIYTFRKTMSCLCCCVPCL